MTGAQITVEVLAVAKDRHGDKTETSAGTIGGCLFAPLTGSEDNDERSQVLTVAQIYAPPTGVPVRATDRIRMPDGTVWDVDGEPQAWASAYSAWAPGSVIQIRRVTG